VRAGVARRGFALVAVVVVLAALLLLATPFLLTARHAESGTTRRVGDAQVRISLDSAARHARAVLSRSHPALDRSPLADSVAELSVSNEFAGDGLDALDPRGVMWDLDVADVAGLVDLNSAPPQVFANLLGAVARLSEAASAGDERFEVPSTAGFADEGFLWIEGELVGYGERQPGGFAGLLRGLGAPSQGATAGRCGPRPARDHGAPVFDQAAWAFALWRAAGPGARLRTFDTFDRLAQAEEFAVAGAIGAGALARCAELGSVYGSERAGARWQRPVRLTRRVDGGDEACFLFVDDARWINAGSTIEISDGDERELALVASAGPGGVVLMEALTGSYEAFEAEVRVLARRPVNLNTAPPAVLRALFENLQLRGRSARITASEARELAGVVVASRPFAGFEDFLARVVLPAAGLDVLPADAPVVPEAFERGAGGLLDVHDAIALYKNGLNANDNELAFSTLPFCFASRDVYALELRASYNAASGLQRAALVREQVEIVAPQEELLTVWTRQSDFDESARLDRDANGWLSGPENTHRHDPTFASGWPTEARAHLAVHDTTPATDPLAEEPAPSFPSSEESGWVQPAPVRVDETDASWQRRSGRVLHFDDETRDFEGRYLPDAAVVLPPDAPAVGWAAAGQALEPFTLEAWIRPRAVEDGRSILEVSGPYPDSDRVSLLFDAGDLVLRVVDGGGDHPDSAFVERSEVRHAVSPSLVAGARGTGGTGGGRGSAGIPTETWTHVSVDVGGGRPDQMSLIVDGRAAERTPGLTELTADLSVTTQTLPVESTEGFPDRCVLKIGDELVEAERRGETAFFATFHDTGELAGFGGRQARERVLVQAAQGGILETNEGELVKDVTHAAGTAVQLYGYSLPLEERVPSAAGALRSPLGRFAVARVEGVLVSGDERTGVQMEEILIQLPGETAPFVRGWGMRGGTSAVDGLVLTAAEEGGDAAAAIRAFDPAGGWAAILGPAFNAVTTVDGDRLGLVEVVRYSGTSGNHLLIQRGPGVTAELPGIAGSVFGTRSAFVFEWNTIFPEQTTWNDDLRLQSFVIPISVAAGADGPPLGFYEERGGDSQFAQITRVGPDAHLTEWVRYDSIVRGELVRDDPVALERARAAAHGVLVPALAVSAGGEDDEEDDDGDDDDDTGGGDDGGDGGGRPDQDTHGGMKPFGGTASLGSGAGPPLALASTAAVEPAGAAAVPVVPTPAAPAQSSSFQWRPRFGTAEDDAEPVTRAVASVFRFRGVLGTHSHDHLTATPVLPVWTARAGSESGGWPGAGDHVMLFDGDPFLPGWPAVVQRAWRPSPAGDPVVEHSWDTSGTLSAVVGPSNVALDAGYDVGVTYVALQAPASVPVLPVASGVSASASGAAAALDVRSLARVALFPSGELPRLCDSVALGPAQAAGVPSVSVDEVVFGSHAQRSSNGSRQLVLANRLGESGGVLDVRLGVLRLPIGDLLVPGHLGFLPLTGGLLRVGSEILCYDSIDATTGELSLPPNGRGLLGTRPRAHAPGESVSFLGAWRTTTLAGPLGVDDASLSVLGLDGIPPSGTVRVGDELVHYSHRRGLELAMPRRSSRAGWRDGRGGGLFRGRFGTVPSAHPVRTPVIVFPVRYEDRYAEQADAPELFSYGARLDQPAALWRSFFWGASEVDGPRLNLLVRTDGTVPWDADPEEADGLFEFRDGEARGAGLAEVPLGRIADRIEWRAFVRHEPGSFDPLAGSSHGWKRVPRLELAGFDYLAPGRVLRSLER